MTWEIEFPSDYFGRREHEVPAEGRLDVVVALGDGRRCPLHFLDPIRLRLEVEEDLRGGVFHDPRLVVVDEVTAESVRAAVVWLSASGALDRIASRD